MGGGGHAGYSQAENEAQVQTEKASKHRPDPGSIQAVLCHSPLPIRVATSIRAGHRRDSCHARQRMVTHKIDTIVGRTY